MRPFLVCALLSVASGLPAQEARMASEGRLRPPGALECDRNQLTSYSGHVSGYKPGAASTWIEISTDEDTVEAITVDHAGKPDASARYLLRGETFTAQDWTKIETAPGKLVADMRAVAWVCLDGKTAPLIDWQPPQP
jgi:hypothetical protein